MRETARLPIPDGSFQIPEGGEEMHPVEPLGLVLAVKADSRGAEEMLEG